MSAESVPHGKLNGRKRIPLLCNQCKRRKVKCDRKLPCSSCVKHKVGDSCEYLEDQVMTHETTGTLMVFKQTQGSEALEPKGGRKKRPKTTVFHVDAPQADQQTYLFDQRGENKLAQIPQVNQVQFSVPVNASYPEYEERKFDLDAGQAKQAPQNGNINAQAYNPEPYTYFGAPFLGVPPNMQGMPHTPGFPPPQRFPSFGGTRSPEDPENKLELDEVFDLYTGYSSVVREGGKNVNHGPFSWFTYIQKDKALRALWDVSNKTHQKAAFQQVPEGKGLEEIRAGRDLVSETPEATQISPNTRQNLKASLNKKTLALGLTIYEGTMDQSLDIIEKLKLILPNKRAVFLLIKRFFQVVYPYVCVIDETYFRGEIFAILGPDSKSEEKFERINIRKKKDFATIGILLIVLRISYLSTFSNIRSENENIVNSPYSLADDILDYSEPASGDSGTEYLSQKQRALLFESKYILTHPVSIDFMQYVRACLDQLTGAHRCSLSVLQCLIMQRIYSDVAPEETDSADGYDASALNASCIHIGYRIGIHRDEDYQGGPHKLVQEVRYANVCRKIWFFVKLMDLKISWQFGFPIMVDHSFSNLKWPYYTPGALNVLNDDLEVKLCSLLTWTGSFYRNFGEMIRRCLMMQYQLKVSELLQLMDMLEDKVSEDLGTLADYTSSGFARNPFSPSQMRRRSRQSGSKSSLSSNLPGIKIEFGGEEMLKEKVLELSEFPFVKVLKLKVYMNMKLFSMSIFYHLFLNFENSQRFDLSYIYLQKIFSFFCGEFLPEILNLLLSSRSNFDSSSTCPGLILNHSIIALIHKCNQIFFAVIIRSRFKILHMKDKPEHKHLLQTSDAYRHRFGKICSLTNILMDISKFNISCLSRLNHRYYYAWRISRTNTQVLERVMSEEFSRKLLELDYHFIELTQPQIDELLNVCQECFTKIERKLNTQPAQNGEFPETPANGHDQQNAEMKSEPVPLVQSYNNLPQDFDFEDYIPSMGIDNFSLEQIPETDLLWQQISNMKEDNKREFNDAPNDISDKFFPLSPQQGMLPPFDMEGAFEGFSNIYV